MQSELKNPQKSVFNSKFIIFIFFGSEQIIKDIRIFHKSNKEKQMRMNAWKKKLVNTYSRDFLWKHAIVCLVSQIQSHKLTETLQQHRNKNQR